MPTQANLVAGRNVSSSSIDSIVFTLDPKDKYLPPGVRRSATTSAIKKQKARLFNHQKDAQTSMPPPKTSASLQRDQTILPEQRSILSIFQKMRQTRSAGSDTKGIIAWPRKIFSRAGKSAKPTVSDDVPEVPKLPIHIVSMHADTKTAPSSHSQKPLSADGPIAQTIPVPPAAAHQAVIVPLPEQDRPFGQDHQTTMVAQDTDLTAPGPASTETGADLGTSGPAARTLRNSATSSYAASDDYSPYCMSNTTRSDPMSPLHLSQPETPSMSEFGDEVTFLRHGSEDAGAPYNQLSTDLMNALEFTAASPPSRPPPPPPAPAPPAMNGKPATARIIFGTFQGYSLPEDDCASVLTIRKPPSTKFLTKTSSKTSPVDQPGHAKTLVNAWKDGSEHLLDDLGYLGDMIN